MQRNLIKKLFCEATSLQIKKEASSFPQTLKYLNPNIKSLNENQIRDIENSGASYVLPQEAVSYIVDSGINQEFNFNKNQYKRNSFIQKYVKNLNLHFEYDELIRDFFQSIAREDYHYLNLVCEAYLAQHVNAKITDLRKKGFLLQLDSLSNKHDLEILDWQMFKNYRINRFKNYEVKGNRIVKSYFNNKFVLTNIEGEDTSIFDNYRPFILRTLVKVSTPMKLSVYNQNYTLKLYGKDKDESVDYLFQFETELSYSDLIAFSFNPNRNSKLRQSRITDVNKVLDGNDFYNEDIEKKVRETSQI